MKTFRFVFVGQAKNPHFRELEGEYHAKILRYVKNSEIQFVKDAVDSNVNLKCEKEGRSFLEKIQKSDFLILCDETGQNFSSRDFSNKISKYHDTYDHLVFGIGGAYGFSPTVKERANLLLSLSACTLPHELARIVLLEQVYRALTISKGEKYHH